MDEQQNEQPILQSFLSISLFSLFLDQSLESHCILRGHKLPSQQWADKMKKNQQVRERDVCFKKAF